MTLKLNLLCGIEQIKLLGEEHPVGAGSLKSCIAQGLKIRIDIYDKVLLGIKWAQS